MGGGVHVRLFLPQTATFVDNLARKMTVEGSFSQDKRMKTLIEAF